MDALRPYVTTDRKLLAQMPARYDHLFRVSAMVDGNVSFSRVPDGEFEVVLRVERKVNKFGSILDHSVTRYGILSDGKFELFQSRLPIKRTRLLEHLPPEPEVQSGARNWKNVRK